MISREIAIKVINFAKMNDKPFGWALVNADLFYVCEYQVQICKDEIKAIWHLYN